MEYKMLEPGDRIQVGDQYFSSISRQWLRTTHFGGVVPDGSPAPYRRPITPTENLPQAQPPAPRDWARLTRDNGTKTVIRANVILGAWCSSAHSAAKPTMVLLLQGHPRSQRFFLDLDELQRVGIPVSHLR